MGFFGTRIPNLPFFSRASFPFLFVGNHQLSRIDETPSCEYNLAHYETGLRISPSPQEFSPCLTGVAGSFCFAKKPNTPESLKSNPWSSGRGFSFSF
jgi:hypothetical protein